MRRISRDTGKPKIFSVHFASVYPTHIQKAEKKGRTKAEVDEIIYWLTGYTKKGLQEQLDKNEDYSAYVSEYTNLGVLVNTFEVNE